MNRRNFLKGCASALIATRLLFPLKPEIEHEPKPAVANVLIRGTPMMWCNLDKDGKPDGEWASFG